MKISTNVSKILAVWVDACFENSGVPNFWRAGGREYIWKISEKTYSDGAASGTIFRCNEKEKRPVSSFRIDNEGFVVRAPLFLRNASKSLEAELALEDMHLKSL